MRSLPACPAPLLEFERSAEQVLCSADSFPPCDVMWAGNSGLKIALAVAGFAVDDLAVAVSGNQLVVRGRRQPEAGPRHYLHRGIAMRRFQRSFVLGAGLQVKSARLENGLLNIEIERAEPPSARTIPVGAPRPGGAPGPGGGERR